MLLRPGQRWIGKSEEFIIARASADYQLPPRPSDTPPKIGGELFALIPLLGQGGVRGGLPK